MRKHKGMRPQDVVILLKIVAQDTQVWNYLTLSYGLSISQSEVSESLHRSAFAGLIDNEKKSVYKKALLDFLIYGIKYVFPVKPGAIVRGMPTAHSARPLSEIITSSEIYVWPDEEGIARGQSIEPLYSSVPKAIKGDVRLYELLALVDAIRVGKARERNIAVEELTKRMTYS
ncbi:hypothetical protein Q0590_31410 [Rhodocytophaga aerolata]|uniref:Transcriptional regulator n=1 Tax=Rhodocytophaga aerolata TaxID=455078 RepID=A0ABT8RFE3_9BACT|nr:hypothetical protein [Rhodocytophaga aerolata]MDO1450824.1 hypothetical protein [Rhodocytophaga aerolata]